MSTGSAPSRRISAGSSCTCTSSSKRSERLEAPGEALELVKRIVRHAALVDEVDADAAHAERVHLVEVAVGYRRLEGDNGAQRADLGAQRVDIRLLSVP